MLSANRLLRMQPLTGVAQSPATNITSIDATKQDVHTEMRSPSRNKTDDQGDKKRRSSGVGRARDLFSSAKQHMSNFGSSSP
ncbi:hypothetical protein MRB53_040003 [Persea americana]|nr:hypothetical protein MRB53_040003 [Persea americana]